MQIKHTLLATSLTALLGGSVAMAETDVTTRTPCELKFAFDSSALPSNAAVALDGIIARSIKYPELRIVLDGNADSVGSEEYNVGLSIRRAEAVRGKLVTLGVDEDKIIISAYGENGARRATQADDRRVTVWTTDEAVVSVIDLTFVNHGTSISWNKPMSMAQLKMPSEPVARR